MSNMSQEILIAYTMGHINPKQAIPLYENELKSNPNNIAALNNIAVCQVKIAVDSSNIEICYLGISNFEKAINIAKKERKQYPIAENNLEWAKKELEKLNG